MKCLVLAAGYATRLYPLTENFPKPLLEVGGKTILDWLVDDIASAGLVDEFVVISNHKFVRHFEDWARKKEAADNPHGVCKLTVLDDGTDSNENRLGAVKDIQYAITKLQLKDDLLVIAGDNVLDFSLTSFMEYACEKNTTCIMRYYEADDRRLSKSGVVEIDENDRVLNMEEKPEKPKSKWCCPPFYYYTKEDAGQVQRGIDEGCQTDAPGSYIAWLCKQTVIHAMEMPGKRYDIGNLESYQQVCREYKGNEQKGGN